MFPTNVGQTDRIFRTVLGLAMLIAFFYTSGPLHWLLLIGIVPLLTAVFSTCPLYSVLGMSTCPVKRG
jgi:hypothetical protein